MSVFYNKSCMEVLDELSTKEEGLTEREAGERYIKFGANVLPEKKKVNKLFRFFAQFSDIMIIILLFAAGVSIFVAVYEKTYSEMIDGFIILGIVLLNALIGFFQELKAEREMKALLKMSEPEAKVIRQGLIKKIASSEITVGDIIVLEAGDILPADVRFIETANCKCDESSLTGESNQILKNANIQLDENTPLGDRKNMGYKGTTITTGRALGAVVHIGSDTELGKIALLLNKSEKEDTPLQKNIKTVGKFITFIVLLIAAITFVLEVLARPGESIMEAFLTAVAISVAAIPESLPAVITIIMSMGVARLSKKKAIIRRLHAVETLGSTEIICSDKTGTLTENVMTVMRLYYNGKLYNSNEKSDSFEFLQLLKVMTLCNDSIKSEKGYVGDPTETALTNYAESCGFSKHQAELENSRVGEIPFDSVRKLMTTVNMTNGVLSSYTKGAPDLILKRCTHALLNGQVVLLGEGLKQNILNANKQMGDSALRVLGCAISKLDYTKESVDSEDIREENLIFVGLVGMMDPPRKEVVAAVKKCKKAHMVPIMITGDHANTAFAVAKEIGIATKESEVLTGAELDKLSEQDFSSVIHKIKVYARVSPQNKVRIVETYKALGKIVAMTGDGVNDAPSLKTANIGIGMGITGTDVTKEVADLIVADDNFATIIVAVEEGRRIYSNIKKTISFLLAANMAEILSLFLATIIYPKLVFLMPVQILFVNLITDSLPAIALGLEPPESNLMEKEPRKASSTIFSHGIGQQIAFMGVVQTICVLGAFIVGYSLTGQNAIATTMSFYTLNIVQLVYLFSMRVNVSVLRANPFKNKWIWLSYAVAFSIFALTVFSPLGTVLGLTNLTLFQWGIVVVASLVVLPISEFVKKIIKLNRTGDEI